MRWGLTAMRRFEALGVIIGDVVTIDVRGPGQGTMLINGAEPREIPFPVLLRGVEENALLPVTEREMEDLLRWHHRRAHLRLVT
jgi:hypothetical protein